MRVPVLDSPQVALQGYSGPGPILREADQSLSRGMLAFGGGLSSAITSAASEAEQRQREARDKADAISQANADAAYKRAETASLIGGPQGNPAYGGTVGAAGLTDDQINSVGAPPDSTPGFLSTRGMDASAQSSQTLEDLNKARLEIANNTFTDPAQKAKWLARNAQDFEDTRRKVQTHTATQFQVAAHDALEGKLSTSLQAVTNDPYDNQASRRLMDDGEASIRALQASPEGGNAAAQKWRSDVVRARVTAFLVDGNVALAERQFFADQKDLSAQEQEVLKGAIDRAKVVKNDGAAKIAGATAASEAFSSAVNPKTTWVDPVHARAEIEKLPEGPVKFEATQFLEHRLKVAEEEKSQAIVSHFNSALAAYQKTGNLAAVPSADAVWLKDKNNKSTNAEADSWERLRSIARADAEHARGAPTTPEEQRAFGQFVIWAASNPDKAATMSEEQFNAQVVGGGDYQGAGTNAGPLAKKDRERAASVLAAYHGREAKPEALSKEERHLLIQGGADSHVFGQGADVTKWSDGEVANLTNGEAQLAAYKAMVRKQTGKDPTPKEFQAKVTDILLRGKIPNSGWWGSTFFEETKTRLEADAQGADFVPTWSKDDKAAAATALKAAGVRVLDDNTIDTYLRRKHGLPAAPVAAKPSAATPAVPAAVPASSSQD